VFEGAGGDDGNVWPWSCWKSHSDPCHLDRSADMWTAPHRWTALLLPALACAAHQPSPAASGPRAADSTSLARATRRSGTDAVGTLDPRELDQMRATRVEELLRGRVAGVEVMRNAAGDLTVRIRGAASFTAGGGEPLYVLDGMPMVRGSGLRSVLDGISPYDIARIDVLKDAGATASYGINGANGVVLITTKRSRHAAP
jgi:TonB-dependent SusC/RagA subfamily outer membrane receptor